MEPRGSMPHSQGLSNSLYPEPNPPKSSHISLKCNLKLSSYVWLGLRKALFPIDLPYLLDLFTLTTIKRMKQLVKFLIV